MHNNRRNVVINLTRSDTEFSLVQRGTYILLFQRKVDVFPLVK